MKAIKFFIAILLIGFVFAGCEDDDVFVPDHDANVFNGEVTAVSTNEAWVHYTEKETFTSIVLPSSAVLKGFIGIIGSLDEDLSRINVVECTYDLNDRAFCATVEMILKNEDGDGVKLRGRVNAPMDESSQARLHVVNGYGAFCGTCGWIETTGQLIENYPVSFTFEGELMIGNDVTGS